MKNKNGFTLIELLVAITIGLVMVGFGSVALNNFNEEQKVESVKQELMANLRLARNYAITNQLPATSPAQTDRVAVTIDNNGLMIIKTQKNDNSDAGHTFFSKDITPNNVFITTSNPIKFSVSDGRSVGMIGGMLSVGVSGVVIKNITIEESGLIYEQ